MTGLLTCVIPSADPRHLRQTVDDLFRNAAGELQVIVSAEGYDPQLPARAGLTVLVHPRLGMRGALNAARAHVRGDWYMKCDEHCGFAAGFDEVVKADCPDHTMLIPRRFSWDAENWCIERNPKGPRDFHLLTSPVWSIRERHDYSIQGYEWAERTRERSHWQGYDGPLTEDCVDETMSLQGSCYVMTRAHYERLGPLQEAGYGTFAQEPQELGLKTQLGGGRMLTTKRTWYGHLHKGKKYGRGYRPDRAEIAAGHEYSAWLWMNHPGMKDFITKWWPIPTWPSDTLENWEKYFPKDATLEQLKAAALEGWTRG